MAFKKKAVVKNEEVDDSSKKIATLEKNIASQKSQVNSLKNQVNNLEKIIARLDEAIKTLSNKNEVDDPKLDKLINCVEAQKNYQNFRKNLRRIK